MKEVKEFVSLDSEDISNLKKLGTAIFELDEIEGVNPANVDFTLDFIDGRYLLRYWIKTKLFAPNDIKPWYRCDIDSTWKLMVSPEMLKFAEEFTKEKNGI